MVKEIKYNRTVGEFIKFLNTPNIIHQEDNCYYRYEIKYNNGLSSTSFCLFNYNECTKQLRINYEEHIDLLFVYNTYFTLMCNNDIINCIIYKFCDDMKIKTSYFEVYLCDEKHSSSVKYTEHL